MKNIMEDLIYWHREYDKRLACDGRLLIRCKKNIPYDFSKSYTERVKKIIRSFDRIYNINKIIG